MTSRTLSAAKSRGWCIALHHKKKHGKDSQKNHMCQKSWRFSVFRCWNFNDVNGYCSWFSKSKEKLHGLAAFPRHFWTSYSHGERSFFVCLDKAGFTSCASKPFEVNVLGWLQHAQSWEWPASIHLLQSDDKALGGQSNSTHFMLKIISISISFSNMNNTTAGLTFITWKFLHGWTNSESQL